MVTNSDILARFGVNADNLPDQRGIISVPFDPYLRLNEDAGQEAIDCIVSKLTENWQSKRQRAPSSSAQNQFVACVRLILLNLLRAETFSAASTVGINTNKQHLDAAKRYHPPFMSVTHFLAAKAELLSSGTMLVAKKGFHFPGHSQTTRYALTEWAKEGLREGAPPLSAYEVEEETEMIRLKDKNGRLCDYIDTEQTIGMRNRLARINSVLSKTNISSIRAPRAHFDFDDDTLPEGRLLYRVFNNQTFEHGGRFYGGWWQSAKRSFRPAITINGESTVEADYKGLHPSILFLRHGLSVPDDPYALVPGADSDKEVRDMAKTTFLALLNAENLRTKEPKNFNPGKYGMSKSEFQKQVICAFSMLPGVFGSGIGVQLQREDSELAEKVMMHFTDQSIAILPVHDSFIVAKHHQDELVMVMRGVFKEQYGADIKVTVKEKKRSHALTKPSTG